MPKHTARHNVIRDIGLGILFFGFLCFSATFCWPQIFEHEVPDQANEPEALTWLEQNNNGPTISLATFHGKNGVRRFVEMLYRASAIYVGVITLFEEPAALRVYLPSDPLKRGEVFEVFNKELELSGYSTEKDTGQIRLTLWFKDNDSG